MNTINKLIKDIVEKFSFLTLPNPPKALQNMTQLDRTNTNSNPSNPEINNIPKIYRMAPKSKPLPNDQKSYEIVLKPDNEIRFIHPIKV